MMIKSPFRSPAKSAKSLSTNNSKKEAVVVMDVPNLATTSHDSSDTVVTTPFRKVTAITTTNQENHKKRPSPATKLGEKAAQRVQRGLEKVTQSADKTASAVNRFGDNLQHISDTWYGLLSVVLLGGLALAGALSLTQVAGLSGLGELFVKEASGVWIVGAHLFNPIIAATLFVFIYTLAKKECETFLEHSKATPK